MNYRRISIILLLVLCLFYTLKFDPHHSKFSFHTITLELEYKDKDIFKAYYSNSNTFNESRSFTHSMKKGKNILEFTVPYNVRRLRFDFGNGENELYITKALFDNTPINTENHKFLKNTEIYSNRVHIFSNDPYVIWGENFANWRNYYYHTILIIQIALFFLLFYVVFLPLRIFLKVFQKEDIIIYVGTLLVPVSSFIFSTSIGQPPFATTAATCAICLPELFLAIMTNRLFISIHKPIAASLMQVLFVSVYLIQSIMLLKTGTFINELALENLDFLPALLLRYKYLIVAFVFVVMVLFLLCYYNSSNSKIKNNNSLFLYIPFSLILIIIINTSNTFHSSYFKAFPNSPIYSLVNNTRKLFKARRSFKNLQLETNKQYPFLKKEIFASSLPFASSNKYPRPQKPNVIVFFIEGMSHRVFSDFPAYYSNLTPNLDSFRNNPQTMRVNNYYNHTAATYRGIQGTLGSVFPLKGGRMGNGKGWDDQNSVDIIKSLPNLISILNADNYQTIFFSPHLQKDPFTSFLHFLNFKDVYYAEKSLSLLQLPEIKLQRSGFLIDNDNLHALIQYLKLRETDNSPFFIGLYNIQTHSGVDVLPEDLHYGDGKNEVLNNIHNLDACWGEFYKYFVNSPYYRNTILILTADHCHYYDVSYRQLAMKNSEYQPYFTDKIPFFIHAPWYDLPHDYSNGVTTSIQFAPTLCHLLNIKEAQNTFMGCSIFDQKETKEYGISFSLGPYYFITPTRVYSEGEIPKIYQNTFIKERNIVELYHYCETSNRVAP